MEKVWWFMVAGIAAIVIIGAIIFLTSGSPPEDKQYDDEKFGGLDLSNIDFPISQSLADQLRDYTYSNCLNLIDQNINFSGIVMYEECGTNCLGGCGEIGADLCYYGVRNEEGCMVYIKSRKADWAPPGGNTIPGIEYKKYEFGEEISYSGIVTQYINYNCNKNNGAGGSAIDSNCIYLILGGL